MVTASIATPQEAFNAQFTNPRLTVYIAGQPVLVRTATYSGQHEVGTTATGTLTLPLPVPDTITPGATVEVQAGHDDFIGTIFSGLIPEDDKALSMRGMILTARLVGWSSRLSEPQREDMVWQGPIGLDALFVALCQALGVPSFIADTTTYIDGVTPILLGGNTQHEEGKVTIRAGSSPLSQLQRMANDYGYYIHDIPSGEVVLRRVSGLPDGDPVATLYEGYHLESVKRTRSIRGIVNYPDIEGITYEDQYGGRVPVRARPATVEPNPLIPNGGIRYKREQSSDIVRQDQAEEILRVYSIDHSETYTPVAFTGVGVPGIAPGDVVQVESETVGASGKYWLMRCDLAFDTLFTGSYGGWAGAGEALPALNDRFEVPIQTAPVHLGDEYVAWYAVPSPTGTSKQWAFTLPQNVTVANVRGWGHSWNSQLVGGVQTDLQVTKWEIWLAGVDQDDDENRPESSGNMPIMNEEYALRRPYSDGLTWWTQFAINLRSLEAGDYILKLVCGVKAGHDDGEVQLVYLECFGAAEPAVLEVAS